MHKFCGTDSQPRDSFTCAMASAAASRSAVEAFSSASARSLLHWLYCSHSSSAVVL